MLTSFCLDFVHPQTKDPLALNDRGDLCSVGNSREVIFPNKSGSFDFTTAADVSDDKEYYDKCYERSARKQLCPINFEKVWDSDPVFELLLKSMGDIRNKKVLLLGNGTSVKELIFISLGAYIIYTDLSMNAIESMKIFLDDCAMPYKTLRHRIEFHAVDALNLPFPDDSLDIIYGFAFVHHVERTDAFFHEIYRCLKRGGICRFFDDAFSPLWQRAKRTVVRPLQMYSHLRGISPADKKATEKGGFTEEEIQGIKQQFGFSELFFARRSFFEYVVNRAAEKLSVKCLRIVAPFARKVDWYLMERTDFIANHGIRLVWGFRK